MVTTPAGPTPTFGEKWCERYYLNRVRTPSTIIINQSPSQLIILVEQRRTSKCASGTVGGTKIEEIGHPNICHIRPTTAVPTIS